MAAVAFQAVFLVAAPFWALMILVPTWSWARRIVASPWIVTPPILAYAILVLTHLSTFRGESAFRTSRGDLSARW